MLQSHPRDNLTENWRILPIAILRRVLHTTSMQYERVTVSLPKDLVAALRQAARDDDRSLSSAVRVAVEHAFRDPAFFLSRVRRFTTHTVDERETVAEQE